MSKNLETSCVFITPLGHPTVRVWAVTFRQNLGWWIQIGSLAVSGAKSSQGSSCRKDEIGIDSKSGKKIIGIDEKYYRPTEVEQLLGDASKAKKELGWRPKTSFEDLVKIMIHADWEKVKKRGY